MNSEQIIKFLNALHAKSIKTAGEWVQSSCPLARFTHQKGTDTKPSFAVKINPGGASSFNCYSCTSGTLGLLLQLLESYAVSAGVSPKALGIASARDVLNNQELAVMPLPPFTEFGHQKAFEEWPQWFLDSFFPIQGSVEALAYVTKGRVADGNQPVPLNALSAFDLRFDGSRRMVVSPYRTVGGRLAGARGRSFALECPKEDRFHDYTWNKVNNASLVWYNERALDTTEPVIVVEGQFDLYNVWQVYPHVIANLSSKATEYKLQKLLQAEFVLFMLDNDKAGQDHQLQYMTWLAQRGQSVGSIDYELKDPAKVDPDWLRETLQGVVSI